LSAQVLIYFSFIGEVVEGVEDSSFAASNSAKASGISILEAYVGEYRLNLCGLFSENCCTAVLKELCVGVILLAAGRI
jgi:hypothetical protein